MARTSQNSTHLYIEDYVNAVEQQGGLLTAYPVVIDNSLTVNGALNSTSNNGGSVVALTAAATISLDPTKGNVFTVTPAQNETINAASVAANGQYLTLVVTTSGTTSYTLTFGTDFISTGTLATGTTSGDYFTVTFVSNGTDYLEVARTVAMS